MSAAKKMNPESPKAKLTRTTERSMRVERTFDASLDRVWRAFTEEKLLAQWWGRGHELKVEKYEFHKGGHWRFVESTEHGPQGFEGRYREITPKTRIVRTFEWDGMPGHVIIESVTFEETKDGRTLMVAESLFHTKEECDGMAASGMEQGMNESYAALDRVLSAL